VKKNTYLNPLILWGATITTLLITPFSFDPLNVSKFASLCIFGFAVLSIWISDTEFLKDPRYRSVLIVSGIFVSVGLLALIATRTNFIQQVFGSAGRHTGFVTYLALASFMLGTVNVANKLFLERLLRFLFVSGIVSSLYGLLQAFDADPLNWTNSYSPVIGFLGNPNFQSSFMAITAVSVIATLLSGKSSLWLNCLYALYVLFAIFLIYKSNSQQGYLVFGAGLGVTLLFWIRGKSKTYVSPALYIGFALVTLIMTILDILQKAPWSSILYKESVSNRGDMWRAGWRMTLDHPIVGVGFDNYGDWYRRYRDSEAIAARGVDTISNTAHNVFLDISTSGGFPLVIAYVGILVLTLRASIRILKRSNSFDAPIVGVIGAWVAYLAQSLISINQIGLAVWGWVFSGAIIGYEIHTRGKDIGPEQKTSEKLGTLLIGGFLGIIIGIPPLVSDLVYRNAIDSREIIQVEKAAYQWPQNGDRMIQVAATFRDNDLLDQGIKVARDATKFAPQRYEAWRVLASLPNLPRSERIQVLTKMKELDPFNPNLK
jgi:O-antigen ligase